MLFLSCCINWIGYLTREDDMHTELGRIGRQMNHVCLLIDDNVLTFDSSETGPSSESSEY